MSLKHKIFSAVTFVFALVAFATFASAQTSTTGTGGDQTQKREWKGKGEGHSGGDRMMGGLNRLNLTAAQKEQVHTLFENYKTSTQAQRDEMRTLAEKKHDGTITADETSRLTELRTQLKASNEQLHSSISAVLTPEQRTQLEQMKEQMKERRENREKGEKTPDTQKDN